MTIDPSYTRRLTVLFYFLLAWLSNIAQATNPCGVVAKIFPATTDSVLTVGSLIDLKSVSINATSAEWLLDGFWSGTNTIDFHYVAPVGLLPISLVAHNGSCTDTTTVFYFSAGKAHNVDSSMFAYYGLSRVSSLPNSMDATPDGGFVLGGYSTLQNNRFCGHQGLIVKLRDKGCVDWAKTLVDTVSYCGYGDIKKIYSSSFDSGYYVSGTDFILKLDKNGNLLWKNIYRFDEFPYRIDPEAMTGDNQGYLYLLNKAWDWGWMITALDAAGNVLWSKYLQMRPNPNAANVECSTYPTGLMWMNGKLYVTGGVRNKDVYFDFLTRLDAHTGKIEWQRGYQNLANPGTKSFDQISNYGDMLMVAGTDGGGQGVFLLDTAGNLRKSIKATLSNSYAPRLTKAQADKQGNIYIMQLTEKALNLQPYFIYYTNFVKIDTSFHKYWTLSQIRSSFADMAVSRRDFGALGFEAGLTTSAYWVADNMKLLKINTRSDNLANYGSSFCNYYTDSYILTTMPMKEYNFNWSLDSAISPQVKPVTSYTLHNAHIESRYNCPDFIDSCQFLRLSGPVLGCSYAEAYTYKLLRNRKCSLTPQWKLPKGVTIKSQTDSSITVQFPGSGVFGISCQLESCIPVFDTLTMVLKSKSTNLNLGADTSICEGSSLTLRAGSTFLNYNWQDNSQDSIFTVVTPGLYWVQVIDSCGNRLRDSILIKSSDISKIDIGPDRSKCNSDTLHLSAPETFLNYSWGNNYNISSLTGQSVVVNPLKDTVYYVKAEKLSGCFAFDTVHISVNTSPLIDLGIDQSFCRNDSVFLDAGSGFQGYQWSNGETTEQVVAKTVGQYSVVATTFTGCKSADTAEVIQVFALPSLNLDKNPGLCLGDKRTFTAGNFSSYLWNTRATTPSINVSIPGTYKVTVTDINGCKASDSASITELYPLPANFLPSDTSICSYGSLDINSTSIFNRYLWSTGSNSSFITITQPGFYWLEATDFNMCRGRDTVSVRPKDCLSGFFMPTAYTPNNDGKNDNLKPLLFGTVNKYEFTVYNRWGQLVFKSRDQTKGWDGKLAGIEQSTGVYVWSCSYQLKDQEMKTVKGTAMLIR